jgi:hypothetical protein
MEFVNKIGLRLSRLLVKYAKPSHIGVLVRDLLRSKNVNRSDQDHLDAAIQWLCRTQEMSGCGGSSGGYSMERGWLPPYPETTGYIIPTLLKYAQLSNDGRYLERAKRMGDWEIDIQLENGAVRGGMGINDHPIVFNTGQVISGWTSLYRETKVNKYLDAAIKAADWLLAIQDEDGKWSKYTYNNVPHAYNSQVAWPLMKAYKYSQDEKYRIAAEKNIHWVLSLCKENGWITHMGFTMEEHPFTHTIAYTLRGLLESSFYLENDFRKQVIECVHNASENIMMRYELRKDSPGAPPKFLSGQMDENWNCVGEYSCLTGNVQLAIVWIKLFKISGDARFLNAALKIIDQVKSTQNLRASNPGILGAIAGSYPVWGKYMTYVYPNWATKYFADAIMLQESIMGDIERKDN